LSKFTPKSGFPFVTSFNTNKMVGVREVQVGEDARPEIRCI
jgi:hypothetical protein